MAEPTPETEPVTTDAENALTETGKAAPAPRMSNTILNLQNVTQNTTSAQGRTADQDWAE
jgi:hypothetical protein